ncbi:hypothetical protein ACOMHN_054036 [Nucella lapillus]
MEQFGKQFPQTVNATEDPKVPGKVSSTDDRHLPTTPLETLPPRTTSQEARQRGSGKKTSAPSLQGSRRRPLLSGLTTPQPPPTEYGGPEDQQGSLADWLSLQEAGPLPERPLSERQQRPVSDRLSPQQALALRERLKGLYALLKSHPALMDRRLQVGSKKPHIPPALQHQHLQDKRSFTHLYSREVCPSRTEWRLLRVARDINNTQVQIFQPHDGSTGHQWFYTTTCLHDVEGQEGQTSFSNPLPDCPSCCHGINTHRFHSHCMTKTSLMMALVRKAEEEQFDWNWIQVNSSCSCYISPA